MNIHVSDIVESYKYAIIGHFGNSGTVDLLLNIVQYWRTYEFSEDNRALHMAL